MTKRADIERLFKAHFAALCRMATMILHDEEAARDVVHDVFATLLDKQGDMTLAATYLYKAVRHRCLNRIRDLDIRRRVMNSYFIGLDEYDVEGYPDEQMLAEIAKIINRDLPSKCRQVIELRFNQGLKFDDIADEMGISQTAVFKHLRHALSIIRENIKEYG